MDTLGTITPQVSRISQSQHRTEALERLRYLALSGNCGLITGASGTGKSLLLGELCSQLKREGLPVAQTDLSGVSPIELPWIVGAQLGSGLSSGRGLIEAWMWIQEFSQSFRSSSRRMAFLIDHLDFADEALIPLLSRLIGAFGESAAWIFSGGEALSESWKAFLNQRIWLRVHLKDLEERETMQFLSRDLLHRGSPARFTADGLEAAQNFTRGRVRNLRQLAEMASLAAETDDVTQINADIVHALAAEMS